MAEYIDREAAIKELINVYEREFPTASGAFDEFATKIVPNVLRSIQSADVAPVVHGHFERAEREVSDAIVLRGWECSVCKRFTRSNFVGDWNFCPNCGAKMDGGEADGQKV